MQETDKIWVNGELVDWADAKVHVGSHGLHYGSGVFEGIRCYETENGPAVFRLQDHLQRLDDSAKVLYMDLPYSVAELRAATHELIAANGLPACYLRPLAFYGYGELGVQATGNPVDVVIMSFPWPAYLGEEGQRTGITTMVSSWERVGPNVIPHVAKATGHLPELDARDDRGPPRRLRRGDHAHPRGLRRRRPGREHLHREGRQAQHARRSRCRSCPGHARHDHPPRRALGYEVEETLLIRTELYLADEVFMVGTATEVAPVRAVDDRHIGVGPITLELQKAYLDVVNGRDQRWADWLDVVETSRARRRGLSVTPRDPALGPLARRAGDRLVAEVLRSGRLSLGPTIDAFEEAVRGDRRRSLRGRGLERNRRPAPALPHRGRRPRRRGDHDAVLVRRLGELRDLRGRDAGLRRHRPAHAEPRSGRRGGRDHGPHTRASSRSTSSATRASSTSSARSASGTASC